MAPGGKPSGAAVERADIVPSRTICMQGLICTRGCNSVSSSPSKQALPNCLPGCRQFVLPPPGVGLALSRAAQHARFWGESPCFAARPVALYVEKFRVLALALLGYPGAASATLKPRAAQRHQRPGGAQAANVGAARRLIAGIASPLLGRPLTVPLGWPRAGTVASNHTFSFLLAAGPEAAPACAASRHSNGNVPSACGSGSRYRSSPTIE